VEFITDLKLHAPPTPKRWEHIWQREIEHIIEDENEDLYIVKKPQRKRKSTAIKSKRKIKNKKTKKR
jgi:hypothetical protein